MVQLIDGVNLYPLDTIPSKGGSIFHCLKSSDENFLDFGEAYFSEIEYQNIKGWKMHSKMHMNLFVAHGAVKFVLYDDRPKSKTFMSFNEITLDSSKNYKRLSVRPGIWFAFQGIKESTISKVLNLSNIEHDPFEQKTININEIEYNWGLL